MKERKKIQEIFSVPEGYFDKLSTNILVQIENLEKDNRKKESYNYIRYIAVAASFIILFSISFFLISILKKQNNKKELDLSYIYIDDFDIYNFQNSQNKNQIDKNYFDYYLLLDNNESIIYEP